MSKNVPFSPGALLLATGTGILTTYTSTSLGAAVGGVGLATRIRLWLIVVLNNASPITTVNWKLQARYNDGVVLSDWQDLPTYLDDVQGAAQPKGSTFELEHTLGSLTAPKPAPGWVQGGYLDKAFGLHDIRAMAKANLAGIAGDSVAIYAQGV